MAEDESSGTSQAPALAEDALLASVNRYGEPVPAPFSPTLSTRRASAPKAAPAPAPAARDGRAAFSANKEALAAKFAGKWKSKAKHHLPAAKKMQVHKLDVARDLESILGGGGSLRAQARQRARDEASERRKAAVRAVYPTTR